MKPPKRESRLLQRRELMKLLTFGGVAYVSSLAGCADRSTRPSVSSPRGESPPPATPRVAASDFFFVQLSDTHWGYSGASNPDAATTLPRAIAAVNALSPQPEFVVFTGDLTHRTDDGALRRQRLTEFQRIVGELTVKDVYFLPGEHDAAADAGAAYREVFGKTYYSFDHKGVHFIAIDNVSGEGAGIGQAQLDWLAQDLRAAGTTPIVVFTHRPLFDLYPEWDWATSDGAQALQLLRSNQHVTVFYGHIHQVHHFETNGIWHHSAKSLIFPMPAPGSVAQKAPLAWDPNSSDHGLGGREIREQSGFSTIQELSWPGLVV